MISCYLRMRGTNFRNSWTVPFNTVESGVGFNYDKSAVVVFNNQEEIKLGDCKGTCTCGFHWRLGEQLIGQVTYYKYLGMELDQNLNLYEFKQRIGKSAQKYGSGL